MFAAGISVLKIHLQLLTSRLWITLGTLFALLDLHTGVYVPGVFAQFPQGDKCWVVLGDFFVKQHCCFVVAVIIGIARLCIRNGISDHRLRVQYIIKMPFNIANVQYTFPGHHISIKPSDKLPVWHLVIFFMFFSFNKY